MTMLHLVDCVRLSIQQENWYAALSTALMLPDVCSGLELDRDTVASDYIDWCDRYVRPVFEEEHNITIPGVEIYVLRCAYLHKGTGDVRGQRKADILEHYRFVAPQKGLTASPRQIPGTRTFQVFVNTFCQVI